MPAGGRADAAAGWAGGRRSAVAHSPLCPGSSSPSAGPLRAPFPLRSAPRGGCVPRPPISSPLIIIILSTNKLC